MNQTPGTAAATTKSTTKNWRYRLGMILFFGAFPIFFATPVVIPLMGLSAMAYATLIGGILLGGGFWERLKQAFEWQSERWAMPFPVTNGLGAAHAARRHLWVREAEHGN